MTIDDFNYVKVYHPPLRVKSNVEGASYIIDFENDQIEKEMNYITEYSINPGGCVIVVHGYDTRHLTDSEPDVYMIERSTKSDECLLYREELEICARRTIKNIINIL